MPHIIHAIASDAKFSVAVLETNGHDGWPGRLSTVRLANRDLGLLFDGLDKSKVHQIESWEVSREGLRPESLESQVKKLPSHLGGSQIAGQERPISRPVDLAAYAQPLLALAEANARRASGIKPARLVIVHGNHEMANEADGPRGRVKADRALDAAHRQQEFLESMACEKGPHHPPRLLRVFEDGQQELYRVPREGDPQPATLAEARELERKNCEAFRAGEATGQEPLTFAEAGAQGKFYAELRERNNALTAQRDQLKTALGNVLADGPAPAAPSRKAPGL